MSSSIRRIICGISGGVDSAVASLILKRKGYEVIGLFMKNWDTTDETGVCSSDKELEDAHRVCKHLDIPLQEVKFVQEYWNEVFSKFLYEYENGMTPNPDILCNKYIKFDAFYKHATEKLDADAIATGHYARTSIGYNITPQCQDVRLLSAVDHVKDQTFFLSQIQQTALRRSIFPVGGLLKKTVKQMASEAGMDFMASKKESMGICFIGSRNFHHFIEQYIPKKPGAFIDFETGEIVGQHKGTHYWTIGQRALIGGQSEAYYILELHPKSQDIIVVKGQNHSSLFTETFYTTAPHWISKPPEEFTKHGKFSGEFRFQHRHPLIKCSVKMCDNSDQLHVSLIQPTRAITPGQYAVFHIGDECVGGAKILTAGPSLWQLNNKDRYPIQQEFL